MNYPTPPAMVLVYWVDSQSYGCEWLSDKETFELALNMSCGFVQEDKEDSLILVQSAGGEKVMNVLTIPKGCILKTRRLSTFEDNVSTPSTTTPQDVQYTETFQQLEKA